MREGKQGRDDLLRRVLPSDLEGLGMVPEFVGRLPVVARLEDLGEGDQVRILEGSQGALLKQLRELLRMRHGADLEFNPGAMRQVAELAHDRGGRARRTRSVVDATLEDVLFAAGEADRDLRLLID